MRPNLPAARTTVDTDSSEIAPDLPIAQPEINAKLLGARSIPARPRAESTHPADTARTAKAQTLVPELSPQEAAAAQQQFSESIVIAEKNMAIAKGRSLSALQTDTVSKVTAFLTEAREASAEGDWVRARNLAKKAQILSEDLARSF